MRRKPRPVYLPSPLLRYTGSRAMTEKKSRSAFITPLILGVVLAAAVLITFVPLADCRRCGGDGWISWMDDAPPPTDPYSLDVCYELISVVPYTRLISTYCPTCNQENKTTLLKNWTYDPASDTMEGARLYSPVFIE